MLQNLNIIFHAFIVSVELAQPDKMQDKGVWRTCAHMFVRIISIRSNLDISVNRLIFILNGGSRRPNLTVH